ncbi:MAG: multidrug effflux MFS transporter [Granulosicoccaceae bacterium]
MPKPLNNMQLSLMLAAIISVIPFAIDAYLPALATMAEDLGYSLHQLELTISSFFVGYALGSLIGGPLSDHYGRRNMGVLGLALFFLTSIAMSASESYQGLLILRFVQAVGGGITTVVVPAIVRDRFERQEAAKVMTTIAFIMMAAPLSAPVIGSLILSFWGWRAIFVFLAVYAAALLILAKAYLPQSRDPAKPLPPFSWQGTLQNYRSVFTHAQARPYFIASICSSAIFLSYLTQAAYLLNEYLGLSAVQFPMVFSGFVVCLMIANRSNAYLLRHWDSRQVFVWGIRLTALFTSALLLASVVAPPASVWVAAGVLLVISSLGLISSNSQSNYLHFFASLSGTASSLLKALEMTIGAMAGALISALYNGTPIPLAAVMFGASSLAFIVVWRAGIHLELKLESKS